MSLTFIDAAELSRLVPMQDAIDAVEAMFRHDVVRAPPRSHLWTGAADLLLMPAWDAEFSGVKVVTVNHANPSAGLPLVHAIYVLFEQTSSTPVAVIDGAALTVLRTAAVSAVATRWLADPHASRLVVFGAGSQARGHLEAMASVRPVASVTIVGRSPDRATSLVETARSAGFDAAVGSPESVATADIVCTCTTSNEPLFDGASLKAGCHVNAVGAYKPDARELDDETIRRSNVVVESKSAVLSEAGDIAIPLERGVISLSDIAELREVVAGTGPPQSIADTTVFKSVGVAGEDLAVASAAARALAAGSPPRQ